MSLFPSSSQFAVSNQSVTFSHSRSKKGIILFDPKQTSATRKEAAMTARPTGRATQEREFVSSPQMIAHEVDVTADQLRFFQRLMKQRYKVDRKGREAKKVEEKNDNKEKEHESARTKGMTTN